MAVLSGLVVTLVATACGRAPGPQPVGPVAVEPEVRVRLDSGNGGTLELGGGDALRVADDRGDLWLTLPTGATLRAAAGGDGVVLSLADRRLGPAPRIEVSARDSNGLVRVGGRDYRGRVVITAARAGLVVVNRLGIEAYLAGVVNAEMGRRGEAEQEALAAQAIVSRTYALRALTRFRERAYDVVATVADQAYGGVRAELAQGWQAVRATRGMVLTYGSEPIEAFFHSTCGGRTSAGAEVYVNGNLPYLRSVSDAAPDGTDWCRLSPRYRWRERWTAAALTAVLRETLPPLGIPRERVAGVRDVIATSHTPSGRVDGITIVLAGERVPVSGPAVRQVLRPASAELLRSASFRLEATRAGDRLTELTALGAGAGHGVGLCQWGAVGRARAGARAREILAAYFPGTALGSRW